MLVNLSDFIDSSQPNKNVSTVPLCGKCGLYKQCKSPKMPVDGDGKKKILIVGEAPGEKEDEKGKPFVGPSGSLLSTELIDFGIDLRKDCWITNAIICRPKNNRTPNNKEILYCRPNVYNAIKKLNPKVIITAGEVATKSILSLFWKDELNDTTYSINRWVGWRIPCQEINSWICPIYHPSFVLREKDKNPQVYKIWSSHIKAISECKNRPFNDVPNYKSKIKILTDPDEICKTVYKLSGGSGIAAFDYETNTLKPDWEESKIVSASICLNGEVSYAFPFIKAVAEPFKMFLKNKKIAKVGSNIKFEDRWSRSKLNVEVENFIWDTMINAHIIDCREGTTGLKFQSFVVLGMGSYNDYVEKFLSPEADSHVNNIHKISIHQLLEYNALDSLLEYYLAMEQMEYLGYGEKKKTT